MGWTLNGSRTRLAQAKQGLQDIRIVDGSPPALDTIPLNTAYRMDATHVYVNIANAADLLANDKTQSERSHRRYLRFVHLYQRMAHFALQRTSATKIDFQNERLHFVVPVVDGDTAASVAEAAALAFVLRSALLNAGDLHAELESPVVSAGVETGVCLVVQNGTRGEREPLFIGNAANRAAKLLAHGSGVYLGGDAREALLMARCLAPPDGIPMRTEDLEACEEHCGSRIYAMDLVTRWKSEQASTPQSEFRHRQPRPPLSDLDLDQLSPANTARMDCATIRADVDGFTNFVARSVSTRAGQEGAVRALHLIRYELRNILNDFGGKKIRYIGDCVDGLVADGTSTTDAKATVARALTIAGAMHDVFKLVADFEPVARSLGLQVGLDFGPVSLTRLGVKGSRDVTAAGQAVLGAEAGQTRCLPGETAVGDGARPHLAEELADLVDSTGKIPRLSASSAAILSQISGRNASEVGLTSKGTQPRYERAYGGGHK